MSIMVEYTEDDWDSIVSANIGNMPVAMFGINFSNLPPNDKINKYLQALYVEGSYAREMAYEITFNIPYNELPLHINDTVPSISGIGSIDLGSIANWRLKRGK